VTGGGRVPAQGPVIVVANHPNGLIDPLLVRLAVGRPVAFLAKSTFWQNPFFRRCMTAFSALPTYRAHEADTSRNEETFAAARGLLAAGGWMALFPEGKSHDATTLQTLKTGAARIALGTAARGTTVTILPVGLLYEDKEVFRSAVVVAVGRPFAVDAGAGEDREAVRTLTARIAEGLAEVVLEADDAVLWRAFLAVAHWTGASELADREARARQLAAAWRRLLVEEPEAAEAVAGLVRRYARALGAVGVRDPFTLEEVSPGAAVSGLAGLALLAPLAALGAGLAWLPYRAVRPAANAMARGHADIVGTIKLLLGFAVLTSTYLAWAALAGWALGGSGPVVQAAGALAVLLLGPLTGLAALRFDEGLTLRREALRGLALRVLRPRLARTLAERRAALAAEVLGRLGATGGNA
jgi:1-acyl-sn-glycerol-3-phosphate acyltransferase